MQGKARLAWGAAPSRSSLASGRARAGRRGPVRGRGARCQATRVLLGATVPLVGAG